MRAPSEHVPSEVSSPSSTGPSAWLVLALLLAAFVAAVGVRSLNVPDEGRYAEVGREMLRSGDWVTPRLDGVPFLDKPPLFYWLEGASFSIFGPGAGSARLVTALLGFLGCALVYVAGARIFGRRAGLLGAVVLAANPYYFVASQYVNHDLAVATWITAAVLAFAVGDRREGRARLGWLLAGYAAMGLGVMTKGLIGLVLPLGAVGVFVAATRRWREVPRYAIPAGLALVAIIAVPWHVVAQQRNPDLLHYLFVVQHFQRFAGSGFNNPTGPAFYPLVIAAGFLPWTPLLPAALARAWRAFRADRVAGRTDLLLLAWAGVVVVFFSIPRSKIAGYVLPALPPLALLVGRELDAILAGAARAPRALRVASGFMALLGLAVAAAPFVVTRIPHPLPPLAAGTTASLLAAGAVALAAAGAAAWAASARPAVALGAMVAFSAVLFAAALPAVPEFTRDSTLPLARELRTRLRDGDVVATWRRWFYDLPMYLDRTEPIVVAEDWDDPEIPRRDNWQRELLLGRDREPRSQAWLVSPAGLVARCPPAARCFVLARQRDVDDAARALALVPVARANGVALLATPAAAGAPAPQGGGALSAPRPAAAGGR